jgi:microsomal epoxide hydrolase
MRIEIPLFVYSQLSVYRIYVFQPVEANHIDLSSNPKWHITKPFGFSAFPKEIVPSPRSWIETTGNLVFYREHDKVRSGLCFHSFIHLILNSPLPSLQGGHFAAVEAPQTLLSDLEAFVSQVW